MAAKVFCNRALCHLRLKPPSFAAAAADAACALEANPGYDKAKLSLRPALSIQLAGSCSSWQTLHCLSARSNFSLCRFSPAIFWRGS